MESVLFILLGGSTVYQKSEMIPDFKIVFFSRFLLYKQFFYVLISQNIFNGP